MDDSLSKGIAAYKAGDKGRAFQLLMRATQDKAAAEQAWLWLSAVVEHDSERLFCLDNLLRLNPNHAAAQRGSAMLRGKDIFPSVPMSPSAAPEAPAGPPPADVTAVQQVFKPAAPVFSQPMVAPSTSPAPAEPAGTDGLYRYAAQELAHKTPPQVLKNNLVDQGVSPEAAAGIVQDTQRAFQKARAEKFRKQMIRGALWTAAGVVVTVLSFVFAAELGGQSILCYGAVIFGIIDLLIGLAGWLANR